MTNPTRPMPWVVAAALCVIAILTRQFLIQPAEIAQRCDTTILALSAAQPWFCNVRAAAIMTYAWHGLLYAAIGLSLVSLVWRRAWIAALTLAVGLVAIVFYTYEAGAVAITIGALVLVRQQSRDAPR